MPPTPARSLRAIYVILALLFTALAIYGSLVPLRFSPTDFGDAWQTFLNGIRTWAPGGSRVDWGVNLLLFVPISFFWLQICAGDSAGRVRKGLSICFVVAGCTALSLGIEFAQNWFPPRVPSAHDVVAQLIGTSVGVGIWLVAGTTASEWIGLYLVDTRPQKQIDWLLQAWLVGLVILSLMPLDLTISPIEIYQKYQRGRIGLMPFTHDYGSILPAVYYQVTDVLIFVPVGMLAATLLRPPSQPVRRFWAAMLIGFCIVLAIELAQLLVMSRFTDTTDLITGSAGVAAGIWIMTRWRGASVDRSAATTALGPPESARRPVPAGKWLLVAVAYVGVLVLVFWAPFDFTTDKQAIKEKLSGFFSVPLSAAMRGSRFTALTALVRKVVFFAPLGVFFVLAAQPLPTRFRRLLLGVLLVAGFCVALGVELGQVVLPARAAVFDDVVLYTLSIILGVAATSRIVHRSKKNA